MKKTQLFREFLSSEKLSGMVLILCSVFSLCVANSPIAEDYLHFWHSQLAGKPLEFWINDALMTVFFLMVGLEIEREFYIGELSNLKKSMLPVLAAIGGMIVPALIHFSFNKDMSSQSGFGIPMATDIAFSLAVLALLGSRVPLSLKIFLTALAIIDDLGAILVIAIFYSDNFSLPDLLIATGIFALMLALNRLKVYKIYVYLTLGCFMWFFMYRSGIHATITGVLLAFAIPFGNGDENSISFRLQHQLHLFVALLIVPLFALANTAIPLGSAGISDLVSPNSLGIGLGLILGKPLGILLFSIGGVLLGLCRLPANVNYRQLIFTACLGGIGFTMSIFITLLAFSDDHLINTSKITVIIASVISGIIGFVGLKIFLPPAKQH